MGRAFPGGYDDSAYCSANEYAVQGGHRISGGCVGEVRLQLCEFDTTLWDNPARWAGSCGFDVYFREMPAFLWCVYRGVPVEKARISSTMLESIDRLIDRTGLLAREDGVLRVDIPVLSRADYTALERIIGPRPRPAEGRAGDGISGVPEGTADRAPRDICEACRPTAGSCPQRSTL